MAGLQSQQGTKHSMHLPVLKLKKNKAIQGLPYLYLSVSTGAAPILRRMAWENGSWRTSFLLTTLGFVLQHALVWSEPFPGWSRARVGVEERDAEEWELWIAGRGQVLKKTLDEGGKKMTFTFPECLGVSSWPKRGSQIQNKQDFFAPQRAANML